MVLSTAGPLAAGATVGAAGTASLAVEADTAVVMGAAMAGAAAPSQSSATMARCAGSDAAIDLTALPLAGIEPDYFLASSLAAGLHEGALMPPHGDYLFTTSAPRGASFSGHSDAL